MNARIASAILAVTDQDFFVGQLGFALTTDAEMRSGTRWVGVSPPGGGTGLVPPGGAGQRPDLVGSSARCISTTSSIRPNFRPTSRSTPASVNPSRACSAIEPALSEPPMAATI